jgi:hypothetical protein
MGNSRGRTINYTPRMTQWEAYDQLPAEVKKALQDALTEWDAYAVLRYARRNSAKSAVAWIRQGDAAFLKKGWEPRRGFRPKMPSPCEEMEVSPLRANW